MIRLVPWPVCVYCGHRVYGIKVRIRRDFAQVTCSYCRDLPQFDPQYAVPLDQWADAR